MEDSRFQTAIYKEVQFGVGNLMVSAVAGSGKTTTLIKCLDLIPEGATAIFLAFNNAIIDELKDRIGGDRENILISTTHSFCWKALMKHYNYKCELKPKKQNRCIEIVCKKKGIKKDKMGSYFYTFSKLIDLVRQTYVTNPDDIISTAQKHSILIDYEDVKMLEEMMTLMNKTNREFDFTDMIYRVIRDDVKLPKYDYIFVDESQDLSKIQQLVIPKIKSRKGRMIAVGDPRQAIYGFAGADVDSYNNLLDLFPKTKELPLSENYRCGWRIIEEAKKINPSITAFKGNGEGIVKSGFVDDIISSDWVVCRNLKPLILMNLYLLSKGVKSFVRGSDIGLGLIALINRTGCTTIKSMRVKYDSSMNKERRRLSDLGVRNPDGTEKMDLMRQKLDILLVLSDGLMFTSQLKDKIRKIFKESGSGVCLSTIHKSKGLENETIYFLCPELIPSKYAEQEWEFQQEENLKYVAITRAKTKLVYVEDYETVLESNKKLLKKLK